MTRDIRPKRAEITIGGDLWTIECNMTVLADVQEACGGDLMPVLNTSIKTVLIWLAAMINDNAERGNLGKRYTWRELGRMITRRELRQIRGAVLDLVASALQDEPDDETDEATEPDEDARKNPESPETVPGV